VRFNEGSYNVPGTDKHAAMEIGRNDRPGMFSLMQRMGALGYLAPVVSLGCNTEACPFRRTSAGRDFVSEHIPPLWVVCTIVGADGVLPVRRTACVTDKTKYYGTLSPVIDEQRKS
jgi:hypothetical protein